MADVVAGVRIPDSNLTRKANDLLRKHGTPLLLADPAERGREHAQNQKGGYGCAP